MPGLKEREKNMLYLALMLHTKRKRKSESVQLIAYFVWKALLVPLWSRSCDKHAISNENFSISVNWQPIFPD